MEQKDVGKTSLSYFRFIYQLSKLAKNSSTNSFIAYLDKITKLDTSQKAFKPGRYARIFNSARNFYDALAQRPLNLMRLDTVIDDIDAIRLSLDGVKVIIDTNVSLNTEYIVEDRLSII